MTLEQGIDMLHRAGYQANYSNHTPGFIKVLDPVMVLTHGGGHRTDYLPITLHPTQVHRFISERS